MKPHQPVEINVGLPAKSIRPEARHSILSRAVSQWAWMPLCALRRQMSSLRTTSTVTACSACCWTRSTAVQSTLAAVSLAGPHFTNKEFFHPAPLMSAYPRQPSSTHLHFLIFGSPAAALAANIVLLGGATQMPGFQRRLLQELRALCETPEYAKLRGRWCRWWWTIVLP